MGALSSATKAASTKRKRKRSASANASWRPEQDRVLAATTAGQDWESVAQRVSSVGPAKTASACQMRHARQERPSQGNKKKETKQGHEKIKRTTTKRDMRLAVAEIFSLYFM